MRRLAIFGRHGNTFEAGEKVFMVGAREDLPLTQQGRLQARAAGAALKHFAASIGVITSGPLQRTYEYARIIAEVAGLHQTVAIDERLRELDYGAWGGLSDQEIVALSGSTEPLDAWRERGERPAGVDFTPSQSIVEQQTAGLLNELTQHQGISVVITSNGRLREVGRIIEPLSNHSWRVGTGRLCVLECIDRVWKVQAWNIEPEHLQVLLSYPS